MRKEHRRVANTLRVERTECLEGSRFVAWQLYGLLAGGSRERLEMWQFYGPVVSAARNRRAGQNIALGHSREPPASKPVELLRYKAAPLQPFGPLNRGVFATLLGFFLFPQGLRAY